MMKKTTIQILVMLALFTFAGCSLTPAKLQEETKRVLPQVQDVAQAVADQAVHDEISLA